MWGSPWRSMEDLLKDLTKDLTEDATFELRYPFSLSSQISDLNFRNTSWSFGGSERRSTWGKSVFKRSWKSITLYHRCTTTLFTYRRHFHNVYFWNNVRKLFWNLHSNGLISVTICTQKLHLFEIVEILPPPPPPSAPTYPSSRNQKASLLLNTKQPFTWVKFIHLWK